MERLTRRTKLGEVVPYIDLSYESEYNDWITDITEKLAEYEDLEEQRLILRLPCKVGDTVYTILSYMDCCRAECIEIKEFCEECEYFQKYYFVKETNFQIQMIAMFNKTVFLTKEEAEAKLKEMEEK